jgi:hypothetical protein
VFRGNSNVGSNPTLSARFLFVPNSTLKLTMRRAVAPPVGGIGHFIYSARKVSQPGELKSA